MITKLDFAQQFLQLGISCIPLLHRNKKPDAALIGGGWEKYTSILSTSQELVQWLATGWNNYGVICGHQNLVVLDFDNIDYFNLWQLWCSSLWVNIAEVAFKVRTARGMHVYLQTIEPACNEKRTGIDVQAQRKFVVGPGCTHPTGTQYVPVGELQLVQVESIAQVLPLEFFPKIVPEPSCGHLGASWNPLPTDDGLKSATNNTEYDAWQSAMFVSDTDLIGAVKQRVRIETLFPDALPSGGNGKWLKTKCLFHDDTNPSAWIDTRRQLYGCTVCGFKPMDAINLYARMHALSESDAVRAMAREVGVWA
jgi:hypothetical protein